ncbi:MAG: peptide/nickel transport system ATP-binding protein [Rhodospirillaceae bacterium]|jgi:peptide/nickel transport system ATP-binding protein|nr:peptide/nickel transport system ATP-binding protein [Rhodospirillaceae bacterium]
MTTLLDVRELSVAFGQTRAVDGISFTLDEGETLGLVGESGCGKSTTALALMRLLQGASVGGAATFGTRDLLRLGEPEMRRVRGAEIAMIFQDPGTALHPLIRAGDQVSEVLRAHLGLSAEQARARTLDLFRKVGIAAPEQRLDAYPHELSGGMSQRVMIAAAIACSPRLLLADEPTTALDVTVQAQILELIRNVSREAGMAVILITHDLGVVAGMTDRVAVMYAGRIVETASTDRLFAAPAHPYSQGLLGSVPKLDSGWEEELSVIPGSVQTAAGAVGCRFAPRCPLASDICRQDPPLKPVADGHFAACWKAS